jgi:hypothetical protein
MNKYHPIVNEMAEGIMSLNPKIELEASAMMANYKLATIASNMRIKVDYQGGRNPAPINFYSVLLLQSGGGKNSSLDTLNNWYFNAIYDRLNKVFMNRRKIYLSSFAEGKERDEVAMGLSVWQPTVGNATEAGMTSLAQTLFDLEFGSPSFEVDEIDKFISAKQEMIDNLFTSYDNGIWATKAIKSEKTKAQVFGVAPNFFGFGTYEALMLNDAIADVFRSKLQSGLARRSFFFREDDDKLPILLTGKEMRELESKASELHKNAETTAKRLLELIVPDNEGLVLTMDEDAKDMMYEFKAESEALANEFKDSILSAEYNGRHFKCVKMAGLYAFISGNKSVSVKDVEYAINLTVNSTESLKRIIKGQSKLERLYLRLRGLNRFVDTNEALDFGIYPSTSTKAIKVHFGELEDLSYKHGDAYECMEIGSMLSVKIRQLISTNSDSCIMSYSMPINGKFNHGDGYVKREMKFEEIPHWITGENICYAPVEFKGGKRNNESAQQLTNMIVLDVDDGMSMDYAKELFAEHYAIIAPTRNHQKEKNGAIGDRFRVILLADKYISTTPEIYKEFMSNIARYYSVKIDEACFDKAHIYYSNPTDDIWFGSCEKKFEVAKLIPKEKKENRKHIAPFVPSGGGALKAYFEQEIIKVAKQGTGAVNLLAKAALATVDKLLMNKDEAEEWLYSLHDIALSIDESYWNKHNFDKEVMLIVEKSYKD